MSEPTSHVPKARLVIAAMVDDLIAEMMRGHEVERTGRRAAEVADGAGRIAREPVATS
jgi:hypothetical protein